MPKQDGFNKNTQDFAAAIARVIPAEVISTAGRDSASYAPVILEQLRRDMPKEEQRKFREVFCGCSPRSRASDKVLLSAIRESINILCKQEGEVTK